MKNFDKALIDPSQRYDNPEEILKDDSLTNEQKINLLLRWAYDEKLFAIADDENMSAEQPNYPSKLGAINRALLELGVDVTKVTEYDTR